MRITKSAMVFEANDLPFEDVPTPEWGEADSTVCMQGLSGKDRGAFELQVMQVGVKKGKMTGNMNLQNARAKLVAMTARVEPNGAHLFTQDEVEALGEKSAIVLERLFQVAQRLSGLSSSDMSELTQIGRAHA